MPDHGVRDANHPPKRMTVPAVRAEAQATARQHERPDCPTTAPSDALTAPGAKQHCLRSSYVWCGYAWRDSLVDGAPTAVPDPTADVDLTVEEGARGCGPPHRAVRGQSR